MQKTIIEEKITLYLKKIGAPRSAQSIALSLKENRREITAILQSMALAKEKDDEGILVYGLIEKSPVTAKIMPKNEATPVAKKATEITGNNAATKKSVDEKTKITTITTIELTPELPHKALKSDTICSNDDDKNNADEWKEGQLLVIPSPLAVPAYKTSDNQLFEQKEAAECHEEELMMADIINGFLIALDLETSAHDIYVDILQKWEKFRAKLISK